MGYVATEFPGTEDSHHVAFNTLQSISLPEEKALAMVSMARYRQKQGDNRQALALLENAARASSVVASWRIRDQIQSNMALAYAERLESEHSIWLAESITDLRQRDKTFSSLARALAARNDIPAAQKSALSISTEKVRIQAEDQVARMMAQKTDPRKAVKTSRILSPGRQRVVFLLAVSRRG